MLINLLRPVPIWFGLFSNARELTVMICQMWNFGANMNFFQGFAGIVYLSLSCGVLTFFPFFSVKRALVVILIDLLDFDNHSFVWLLLNDV